MGRDVSQRLGLGDHDHTTHRQLAEGARFSPAAVPHSLHSFQRDETLARPFWACTSAALHCAECCASFDRRVPVAQPDCAKRAVAEHFELGVGSLGVCGQRFPEPPLTWLVDSDTAVAQRRRQWRGHAHVAAVAYHGLVVHGQNFVCAACEKGIARSAAAVRVLVAPAALLELVWRGQRRAVVAGAQGRLMARGRGGWGHPLWGGQRRTGGVDRAALGAGVC